MAKFPLRPRMEENVYHPCIHLFNNFWSKTKVENAANKIKEMILGDAKKACCYKGPKGEAQLAVQMEFIPLEFSQKPLAEALDILDQRLDALFEAGFAVHLLLPVHQTPKNGWAGVDWETAKSSWPGSVFVPYQPTIKEFTDGQQSPYDVLAEKFHKPVIQHLIETGRAQNLAVIYLLNEFGYAPNELKDNKSHWNNVMDWKLYRSQALFETTKRVLEKGRAVANGKVPVGLKFAKVTEPNTGWTPFSPSAPDQLKNILNVVGPAGDVVAFDLYFKDGDLYDVANRKRFESFMPLFKPGYFEIGEAGRFCHGDVCSFKEGSRTTAEDMIGMADYWPEAKGLNIFAWNATGPWDGCYAVVKDSTGEPCPGGEEEMKGLWDLVKHVTGSENPEPCAVLGEKTFSLFQKLAAILASLMALILLLVKILLGD